MFIKTYNIFISPVIGMKMPGNGAVYLEQNICYKKPVYIGDTVTTKVTIISVEEKNRAVLRIEVINQDGAEVAVGSAKVILPIEKEQ